MRRPVITILVLAALLTIVTDAIAERGKTTISEGTDESSEQRLWAHAEEETRTIDRSGWLYEDKDLDDYVNAVARKLSEPGSPPISVKIIKNPYLNAMAYPTGRIYIHTGMLAAIENEAQLAVLLGHEMTHIVNHHAAQEFMNMKKRNRSKISLGSWLGSFGESGPMERNRGRKRLFADNGIGSGQGRASPGGPRRLQSSRSAQAF